MFKKYITSFCLVIVLSAAMYGSEGSLTLKELLEVAPLPLRLIHKFQVKR
ncbi:MAG TPA: hypothetical protein LFW21_02590 [Rickettsia endosymbiont of Pyrocoelia pectoralis]|nr:hypothetical protein [Rickettsia endosymbiont of Pyrocoelia pectoralis]